MTFLYEPVFLAGGLLCAAAALAYQRSTGLRLRRPSGRPTRPAAVVDG